MTAAGAAGRPPALELAGIAKSFGPVHALRGVSLSVPRGSITGIVGENGAGKSTLMNVVYGLVQPDAGRILVDGTAVNPAGPRDALRHGIGMVHQHFMLVEPFTVLENVVLGHEGGALLGPALAAARARLLAVAAEHGLQVDPDVPAGDLPVGDQQRVEILKALYRGARILILDEPTAVLTPGETDGLFATLRRLAAGGTTILLITHKLREIMALTDGVVVMRGGTVVGTRRTAETRPDELADLMVGRGPRPAPSPRRAAPGAVVLEAVGVASGPIAAVDLRVRSGEIVGVAGISGNGQTELLEVLSGMRPVGAGLVRIAGREVDRDRPADPASMRALGVAHVPEDRHRFGMVGPFSAAESAILGQQDRPGFSPRGLLDRRAIRRHCEGLMARFDVRPPSPGHPAGLFSGGNQQKLVMAREIATDPRVLLVGQPTRGVDIGAIATIHGELAALRDRGCAILVVSAELDEILALSDRIVVMCGGRVTGELARSEADEGRLGLLMAGDVGPREAAA